MPEPTKPVSTPSFQPPKVNMFGIIVPYKWQIGLLIVFSIISNALSLIVPKLVAMGIDTYTVLHTVSSTLILEFSLVTISVFIFTYLQSVIQTYASELVAKDFRRDLTDKISRQTYAYIQTVTPSVLLTNLTSDIDAIKSFVAQAIASIVSSIFLILGASILLLLTNWQLALVVLLIVPIIGITFGMVLGRVRVLFMKSQGVIDRLNKVINESILGSALVRVLNSESQESQKFSVANRDARDLGLQILSYFATLIPVITFVASLATLAILVLGGWFVIGNTMTLGEFAAFNSYVSILIFPIIMIGFMSNVIARSSASYARVLQVMQAKDQEFFGTVKNDLTGDVVVTDLNVTYGQKEILKNISFTITHGSRTAIIGPTAAGKSQLLYLLSGLIKPTAGKIEYGGIVIAEIDKNSFYQHLGLVFQDSSIFNMTLRENIAFNGQVSQKDLATAIKTAELNEFIASLPKGLETIVSERGSSLSGGQKQRMMLARALSLDPTILLLDDFTARVDTTTEQAILKNVQENYPNLTLVSVTQKISSVENYDQIIMLMEGEIVAIGKHQKLLETSPEYAQLYASQRSTNAYELQT